MTNQIQWDCSGTIASVNVYYDSDGATGGYSWVLQGSKSQTGNTGINITYDWLPDSTVRNGAIIRITDAANETDTESIGTAFNVGADFLPIGPNGGEPGIFAEETYNITWDKHSITGVTNVLIEFSTDGGSNYSTIGTFTNSGSHTWNVDGSVLTTDGKVRISDPNQAAAVGVSTGSFKIQGSVTVGAPNTGSEAWDAGSPYEINWTKTGAIATINILYSSDSGSTYPTTIVSAIDPTGVPAASYKYDWTIPAVIALGSIPAFGSQVVSGEEVCIHEYPDGTFGTVLCAAEIA